jgi:tRNA A37 N6-isopentenylltransferase MiaA
VDPKTGRVDEVYNITKSTMETLQKTLNEMSRIIKDCAQWEHSKVLDKRIADFMKREIDA